MILAAPLNVLEYRQQMFRFGWILSPADKQANDRFLAVDTRRAFADMSLTHLKLGFEALHRITPIGHIIAQRLFRYITPNTVAKNGLRMLTGKYSRGNR
jgi:hypothetical protein